MNKAKAISAELLELYLKNKLKEMKKSRIRETKNLSTDADSRTDTILERLRDLSLKTKTKQKNIR